MRLEIIFRNLIHHNHDQGEEAAGPQGKEGVICEHPHGLIPSLWHPEDENMIINILIQGVPKQDEVLRGSDL